MSQNEYYTKDNTFKETHRIRNKNNVVILTGDKYSSVIIMNRSDYTKKVELMLQQGISEGKYVKTEDNVSKELKSFQSFIYRHFKKSTFYNDMMPFSHKPARLFTSAKTHKFENFDDINIKELKLRAIIDQTGICYYKTGKVIAQYLKPLTKTEFVINNTQDFPSMLNRVKRSEDEEDVSYDVESLFTNIPINETIDFICDEIYIHKKRQPICRRFVFNKLLLKLTTERTFRINEQFCKQIDGVFMGGIWSMVLSDCFMNKMEKVVIPLRQEFYKRFVDDIYRRRKRNEPDELFDNMNSYHPNIKLIIEVSPKKSRNISKLVILPNSLLL